jgi:hypothetical protein
MIDRGEAELRQIREEQTWRDEWLHGDIDVDTSDLETTDEATEEGGDGN